MTATLPAATERLTRLEGSSGEFPFYNGTPVTLSGGQWLLPAADGSIQILRPDGHLSDSFNYGAALSGLATVEWNGRETLHSPHLNVRLGVRYYKELVDRFGDEHVALTAYCFGPSRVSMQLRAGTFDGSRYARDILAHYRQLHDPSA